MFSYYIWFGNFYQFQTAGQTYIIFSYRDLDMSKYLLNPNETESSTNVYDLCAVINHHGHSLSIGHYTTFARTHNSVDSSKQELDWRLFDDQHVMPVRNEKQIVSQDAYVLMYRLRDGGETAANSHNKEEEKINSQESELIPDLSSSSPSASSSDSDENIKGETSNIDRLNEQEADDDDADDEFFDIESDESANEVEDESANEEFHFTNLNEID
jgi:hypothetical protein